MTKKGHSKLPTISFWNVGVKCYCEHQNETNPLNGIICGSQGSIHRRVGYCLSNERCTGTSDRNQGVDFATRRQLCSTGRI